MFPLNLGIRAHDLDVRNREEIVQKVSQLHLSHIQFAPQKAFPEQLKLTDMTLGSAAYFGEYFQKNNIELSILGMLYQPIQQKYKKFVHKHWQLSNSKLLCALPIKPR